MDLFAPVSLTNLDTLAPALGQLDQSEYEVVRKNIKNFEYLLTRSFNGFHFLRQKVDVIAFQTLLMLDWDIAPDKPDDHFTVSSFEEIQQILEERVSKHPSEKWALYKTPNGAHAFLISHHTPTEVGVEIQTAMRGDQLYSKYTAWDKAYSCRVSKKDRPGDFVASFVRCYGSGFSLPEQERILSIHDLFIYGRAYRP